MTAMQEHLLALLREVDRLCAERKLPYVLFGPSAAYALAGEGTFGEEISVLQLLMTGRDAAVLAAELEKRAQQEKARAVESLRTNPYLPQNVVRYVDSGTTRIDLKTLGGIRCPGAAVEIVPLIGRGAGKADLLSEGGLLYLNGGQDLKPVDYRGRLEWSIRATQRACALLGRQKVAGRVWAMNEKSCAGVQAKGKMLVRWGGGSMKSFDASFLTKQRRVPLEDLMVPVPEDWAACSRALEPDGWAEKEQTLLAQLCGRDLIEDAQTPYADTIAALAREGMDLARLCRAQQAYTEAWVRDYLPLEKKAQTAYLSAKRSVERIDLYCALLPQRKALRRAAKQGDWKRVETILQPYLKAADRYLYRGMGLFLDREVYDYAAHLWKQKGQRTKAARVWLLTPPAQRRGDLHRELEEERT